MNVFPLCCARHGFNTELNLMVPFALITPLLVSTSWGTLQQVESEHPWACPDCQLFAMSVVWPLLLSLVSICWNST